MAEKIKTAAELADRAENVAKNYKTLYVMGCFGAPMTKKNKARYTKNNEYNRRPQRTAMINAADADTFGFDCVCLIKGLLWGWEGDGRHVYGGAKYESNGVPDIGADSMIKVCKDVTADFSAIEKGEAVWAPGHIGIYIGGGLAVECTPAWKNRVQITACNTDRPGYSRRSWKKHGKLPYIAYGSENGSVEKEPAEKPAPLPPPAPPAPPEPIKEIKTGDIVIFTGCRHYASAGAAAGPACRPGIAKVTRIYRPGKAKHPYHLAAVSGGGSNVYGWVDAADIAKTARGHEPAAVYTVKRGDCLWSIAARQLGRGSRWTEIKAINGLTSIFIHTGQKLKLPKK